MRMGSEQTGDGGVGGETRRGARSAVALYSVRLFLSHVFLFALSLSHACMHVIITTETAPSHQMVG